jgi:hypothetical protein
MFLRRHARSPSNREATPWSERFRGLARGGQVSPTVLGVSRDSQAAVSAACSADTRRPRSCSSRSPPRSGTARRTCRTACCSGKGRTARRSSTAWRRRPECRARSSERAWAPEPGQVQGARLERGRARAAARPASGPVPVRAARTWGTGRAGAAAADSPAEAGSLAGNPAAEGGSPADSPGEAGSRSLAGAGDSRSRSRPAGRAPWPWERRRGGRRACSRRRGGRRREKRWRGRRGGRQRAWGESITTGGGARARRDERHPPPHGPTVQLPETGFTVAPEPWYATSV